MNAFDSSILAWFNQFARRSHVFDSAVVVLAHTNLAKGFALCAILWWLWFCSEAQERHRPIIVATLMACFTALLVGRGLAHYLPFRIRPAHDTALGFVAPFSQWADDHGGWSAFPSDHAMVFATFATGLLFVRPLLGVAAHAYAAIFIGLPRLYLGLHHPTDLLAGAALGVALGAAANHPRVRSALAAVPMAWMRRHASSFYACFFLITVQIATLFSDARWLASAISAARASARP
jgi:undecaprenyl-diphosphatase